uniref:Uncharacterized protein n=1 Tax=Meloidogyne floridensis TaxID=298350 RepID=A0A915NN51_9BILA
MSEWDRLVEKLRHPENPVVFFYVAAGGAPIGAVLSRSVTALVEDATEMADREAANALFQLDMLEWEGADLPVYHHGLPIMNVAVEIAKDWINWQMERVKFSPQLIFLNLTLQLTFLEKPSKESLNSLRVNIYRLERLCDSWLNTGHYSNVPDRLRFSYLNSICGHRLVPVELGNKYTDEDWEQKIIKFNEYLIKYIFPPRKQKEEKNIKIGYLAQHRLLDQIPELINDLIIPEYCSFVEEEKEKSEFTINVYIGPEGTGKV